MKAKLILILLLVGVIIAAAVYYTSFHKPDSLTLTGIVTTDSVIVSPQMRGQIQQLLVKEGDVVKSQQEIAVIDPQEMKADTAYYASSVEQYAAMEKQAESDLQNAQATWDRDQNLKQSGAISAQAYDDAKFALQGAKMRVDSLKQQIEAAKAQHDKSNVQLGYTKIDAPIDGIVDTRVALQGEVVNAGQPIVTLINPDDLWVRVDVEETYIDRIKLGDTLKVRLPSGETRDGTVFYRRVDADYATQRDVSRTKRDIKTFEIRLRCDNHDRALAVGMTAYVDLPLK